MNSPEAGEDARWAEAAALGDMQAFECLVRRHHGAVRALLRRLAPDAAGADDLCQAAFVAAWRKLGGFRGGSFRAWVCTIGYRLHARQRARQRPGHAGTEIEAAVPQPSSPGQRIDLDRAIAGLPPAQREAIMLSFVAGMSHAEVAQATGWPIGTVKSHIHRAKENLRAQLEGYGHDH